jgi:protease YdgD
MARLSRAVFALTVVGACSLPCAPATNAQSVPQAAPPSSTPKSTARQPIWSDQWPWSSIGRINIAITTKRGTCTASLVGLRTIITAAHCLYDDRLHQWIGAENVHFITGLSPGLKHYTGHSVALRYVISPNYKVESEGQKPDYRPRPPGAPPPKFPESMMSMRRDDWAVVTLNDALDLKPIPVQSMKNASLPESTAQEIVVPGYGADRPHLLTISRGCSAVTDDPQWGEGYLIHSCEIALGVSGGPVLLLQDQDAALIGIATAGPQIRPGKTALGGLGVSATQFADAILSANEGHY